MMTVEPARARVKLKAAGLASIAVAPPVVQQRSSSSTRSSHASVRAFKRSFSLGKKLARIAIAGHETDDERRIRKLDEASKARDALFRKNAGMSMTNVVSMAKIDKAEKALSARGRPWYIISPFSRFMSCWDGVTAMALLFTALVTPFEVGFLGPPASLLDPLFLVNRAIDIIFIIDMGLQFVLMYRRGGEDTSETAWEVRPSRIALHYVSGWFSLDVASIIPSAFDVVPLLSPDGASSGGFVRVMRIVRAARLVKLIRLMRASRVLKRVELRIALPYAAITLITLTLQVILASHYVACVLGIQASLIAPTPLASWQATHGYCAATDAAALAAATSLDEIETVDFACTDVGDIYLQAFYWGTGMLARLTQCVYGAWCGGAGMIAGFSSAPLVGPLPRYYYIGGPGTLFNRGEQVLLLVLFLLASFQWAYITGKFVDIISNSNPDATNFRNGLDKLNSFCAFHRLSSDVSIRLREFYHSKKELMRMQARSDVAEGFSPGHAEQVVWETNRAWLVRAPCFAVLASERAPVLEQEAQLDAQRAAQGEPQGLTHSEPPLLEAERLERRQKLEERMALHTQMQMEAKGFLVQVAVSLSNSVFAPSDRLPARRLYVILKGSAVFGGRTLGKGDSFGEQDVMLTGARARLQAYAVTFLHVQYVGPEALAALQQDYPKAYAAVKRWAVYRAAAEWLREYKRRVDREIKHSQRFKRGLASVQQRLRVSRAFGAGPSALAQYMKRKQPSLAGDAAVQTLRVHHEGREQQTDAAAEQTTPVASMIPTTRTSSNDVDSHLVAVLERSRLCIQELTEAVAKLSVRSSAGTDSDAKH